MKNRKLECRIGVTPALPARKPGVASLLIRIAQSLLSGGMFWFVCLGGALFVFLDSNHLPVKDLPVMIVFPVLIVALLRGIRAWQADLDDYQKDLTEYRMNLEAARKCRQVNKVIIWDRH